MKPLSRHAQRHSSQLQIDHLVLSGFSHGDAQRVRDAFTSTLQQGFEQHISNGTSISSRQKERCALTPVHASNPHIIGRLAAEALLESLRDE